MRKQWTTLHAGANIGFRPILDPAGSGPLMLEEQTDSTYSTNTRTGSARTNVTESERSTNTRTGSARTNGTESERSNHRQSDRPYYVGLQQSSGVDVAVNYGKERCAALDARLGLDKRFWLVN
jgi:hypothetical protein